MKATPITAEEKAANDRVKEQQTIENLSPDEQILYDKTKTKEERKAAYGRMKQAFMNPKSNFNANTFDFFDDGTEEYDIMKRPRKDPPNRLPTMGLKPKEILEGQMIGEYESKQDLYLLIAWLSERVSALEEKK